MNNKGIKQNFQCINELDEDFFNKWETLKNVYAPKLDEGALKRVIAFTPHDFKRHCIGIYKNLDLLIPKNNYGTTLGQEELFILDIAVLLHDITMAFDSDKRATHSKDAAEYLLSQVYGLDLDKIQTLLNEEKGKEAIFESIEQINKSSVLSEILSNKHVKCVSQVVLGHSDVKSERVISSIDSLPDEGQFITDNFGKEINVRILAALLRMADELDITSNRIEGINYDKYSINADSQPHWRKLELIADVQKDSRGREILILVDEEVYNRSRSKELDIKLIREVRNKVKNELDMLNNKVFYKFGFHDWKFNKVTIKASDDIIKAIQEQDNQNPLTDKISDEIKKKDLKVDDSEFAQRLSDLVMVNKYLVSGHYEIRKNTYARDWINIHALLDNKDVFSEIVDQFVKKIDDSTDHCVIGIDFEGITMASAIGYKSNSSFSYVISEKNKSRHVPQEVVFDIQKGIKVILVTDVIVTGDTLKKAILELENSGISDRDIEAVFAIFQRKPVTCLDGSNLCKNTFDIETKYIDKLYVLNNNIDIEICSKATCYFREHNIIKHSNLPL